MKSYTKWLNLIQNINWIKYFREEKKEEGNIRTILKLSKLMTDEKFDYKFLLAKIVQSYIYRRTQKQKFYFEN